MSGSGISKKKWTIRKLFCIICVLYFGKSTKNTNKLEFVIFSPLFIFFVLSFRINYKCGPIQWTVKQPNYIWQQIRFNSKSKSCLFPIIVIVLIPSAWIWKAGRPRSIYSQFMNIHKNTHKWNEVNKNIIKISNLWWKMEFILHMVAPVSRISRSLRLGYDNNPATYFHITTSD